MIIEKLHIINFGKLQNFTLELAEGINIIEGSNESGKSTLCSFIKFMFYGLSPDANERARSISWQSATAVGTLTFRDGGSVYRIEREALTVKSTAEGKATVREKCTVIDAETGKPLYKGKVPGEVFFGIPRSVFESTAFIGQLEGTKAGDKTLAEATENILFSADETVNTKKALKKLDEARIHLLHKNRKGGKIHDQHEKRASLCQRLAAAQSANAEIISTEGALRTVREAKEKNAASLAKVRAEIAAHERFLIRQSYAKLDEQDAKMEAADALLKKLAAENRYGTGITEEQFAAKLGEEKVRLVALETRLQSAHGVQKEAEAKLAALTSSLGELPEDSSCEDMLEAEASGTKKSKSMRTAACIFSALTALCSLLILINPFIALAALAVMLGFACTFWVLFAKACKKLREECYDIFEVSTSAEFRTAVAKRQKAEAELRFAERAAEEAAERTMQIKAQLDALKSAIKTTLSGAGFATGENILADIEKASLAARAAGEKRKNAAREKSAAGEKRAEITALLENIPEEERGKALEEEFDEEAMLAFDARARKRDADFYAGSISAQTEKIHAYECELAALTASCERPAEIAQEISALDAQIAESNEKFEAYVAAMDAISAASGKLRDGISPKIALEASELMASLSGGKYDSLFVNSEFGMTYSADGITRDATTLSAGTSDIAYISLRIALAKTLCKNKLPPFVFDESFARMDDTRLTSALKIIEKKFGSGAQAILFTCHGRESTLAKNTVKSTSLSI